MNGRARAQNYLSTTFMLEKWIPDSQKFLALLNRVHSQFQDIVGAELRQSLEFQNEVAESLKVAERQAAAALIQVSKNLSSTSADEIANGVHEIEAILESMESKLSECVDSIVNIDTQLPSPQRLLAAQLPRASQFPLLHEKIHESSLYRTPFLLGAHPSKAETSVCNDHAVNTTGFRSIDQP